MQRNQGRYCRLRAWATRSHRLRCRRFSFRLDNARRPICSLCSYTKASNGSYSKSKNRNQLLPLPLQQQQNQLQLQQFQREDQAQRLQQDIQHNSIRVVPGVR